MLGVPACDFAGTGQHYATPIAEADSESSPGSERYRSPLSDTLWPPEPDFSLRGFDAEQVKQLYRQLNHHCQLLTQVYALTACKVSHQNTADQVRNLLDDYQVSQWRIGTHLLWGGLPCDKVVSLC